MSVAKRYWSQRGTGLADIKHIAKMTQPQFPSQDLSNTHNQLFAENLMLELTPTPLHCQLLAHVQCSSAEYWPFWRMYYVLLINTFLYNHGHWSMSIIAMAKFALTGKSAWIWWKCARSLVQSIHLDNNNVHGCISFWKLLIFPKSRLVVCFRNFETSSKF